MPFTVITLTEVAIVSLERVGFNLRNLDMAVVFKDLTRDVFRIDAIPSTALDNIRVCHCIRLPQAQEAPWLMMPRPCCATLSRATTSFPCTAWSEHHQQNQCHSIVSMLLVMLEEACCEPHLRLCQCLDVLHGCTEPWGFWG